MIKQERINRGWTLEFVAQHAGITKAAYRNIEASVRRPSFDVLIRLLDLFEYNDPRLLFGATTPTTQNTPDGNQALNHAI